MYSCLLVSCSLISHDGISIRISFEILILFANINSDFLLLNLVKKTLYSPSYFRIANFNLAFSRFGNLAFLRGKSYYSWETTEKKPYPLGQVINFTF